MYPELIGYRLSLPNAFLVIFIPGAACLLLYSFLSTRLMMLYTVSESKPCLIISSGCLSSSIYNSRIGSSIS